MLAKGERGRSQKVHAHDIVGHALFSLLDGVPDAEDGWPEAKLLVVVGGASGCRWGGCSLEIGGATVLAPIHLVLEAQVGVSAQKPWQA